MLRDFFFFKKYFEAWVSAALSSVFEKPAYQQEEAVKMALAGLRYWFMRSSITTF